MRNEGPESAQFDEFFHALYGCDPFPWQARLARRVAEPGGDAAWPEALALPTAAGKTACIDMAVFALACQVDRPPGERAAPRRVFFVVDRRVIVDATFRRARDLALRLREARTDGESILREVADRLGRLACGEGLLWKGIAAAMIPAIIPWPSFSSGAGCTATIPGPGRPSSPPWWSPPWTSSPPGCCSGDTGPARACGPSTPFGGQRLSDRPGRSHCANPFRQTVDAVRRYRQWAGESGGVGPAPFHLTLLSATPPRKSGIPSGTRTTTAAIGSWGPGSKHPSRPGWSKPEPPERRCRIRDGRLPGTAGRADCRRGEGPRRRGTPEHRGHGQPGPHGAPGISTPQTGGEEDVTLLTGRMRPIDRDDIGQA